jgi:hypothetical protein
MEGHRVGKAVFLTERPESATSKATTITESVVRSEVVIPQFTPDREPTEEEFYALEREMEEHFDKCKEIVR